MKEDELLLAGLADKIDQCERYGMLTHSPFLDLRQGALARAYCAKCRGLKRGEIRKQAKTLISSRFKDSGQTGYK